MQELLILVDQNNQPIGTAEKIYTHVQGLLHRAFSVLLLNDAGEILLQRRSAHKYHCPLLWANTCCGHPRPGEEIYAAAKRRLTEELGIVTMALDLQEKTTIHYHLSLANGLIEHEYTHIFTANYNGAVLLNSEEVQEVQWSSLDDIERWLRRAPEDFAPWFALYVEQYKQQIF